MIEAIERATLDAVAPSYVAHVQGWLVPFDQGSVDRAKSAVPITHAAPDIRALDLILAMYEQGVTDHGICLASSQSAQFRLPDVQNFDPLKAELSSRGFVVGRPTHVQIAEPNALVSAPEILNWPYRLVLNTQADQTWASVYRRQGFDIRDAEHRIRVLSLATDAVYGTLVDQDGLAVAAGVMAFSHGWASVHGMRTDPLFQGLGLATQLLAGFGRHALKRSFSQVFLQVEADNERALTLYKRIGFKAQWQYSYWAPYGK